jgi:ketosteroid isomerase-like protein
MKRLAIGIVLCLSVCASSVYSQTAEGALSEYDRLWNAKDVKGVAQILADDYVYFSSTGDLTTRKATLEFLASPDYKLTSANRSEIKVLSQGETIAIVSSRWKGRGTYGKEEINDDQRCGLVFIKQKNSWKLLSEHCVQIVSK